MSAVYLCCLMNYECDLNFFLHHNHIQLSTFFCNNNNNNFLQLWRANDGFLRLILLLNGLQSKVNNFDTKSICGSEAV